MTRALDPDYWRMSRADVDARFERRQAAYNAARDAGASIAEAGQKMLASKAA